MGKADAFREYQDDRAQVLQAWLAEALLLLETANDWTLTKWRNRLTALREHLRNEGLAT